ncbi:heme-thiolate peroxidase [Bondarzewia mesenterica]|uniref:Heme-thiolate peroxidase n=1 Tax=Bondarzewia mesenterica TaxID=1095465 RepID=A0A4S4LZY0_9AGAM|nr:heme-thiolate peroxidase [Bondarzewia mesenterica]
MLTTFTMDSLAASMITTSTSIVPEIAATAGPKVSLCLRCWTLKAVRAVLEQILGFIRALLDLVVSLLPEAISVPTQKPRPLFPFPDEQHQYIPPKETDRRSPCPALNTLANHGFIPRDGRNIHPHQLVRGLREGFNLSLPLSLFLTYGALFLLSQFRFISLSDFARHNCIEHDASLAYANTRRNSEYAPCRLDEECLQAMLADSTDRVGLTVHDIARARVRRERGRTLDKMHAEIARGEMALMMGIFGGEKKEIPLEVVTELWSQGRFPKGWAPTKTQGLLHTSRTSAEIRKSMKDVETERRR